MAANGKPVIVPPVFPNAGVRHWYFAQLDALIGQMYTSARVELFPAVIETPAIVAYDEARAPNAAGVMFRSGLMFLLLKRSDGLGWAFPGGGIEKGETPEQAARREGFEEMGHFYNGPLHFDHVQAWESARFATFIAEVSEPFFPVLNDEHTNYRWVTPAEAFTMQLHPGVKATLQMMFGTPLAEDAAGPTKQLQKALEKWGSQWIQKFDLMARKIADDFAAKNQNATQTAVRGAFKQAGFTVAFAPTRKSIAAYQAVAAEQVGLIKSIAQKFHTDVQSMVWESVKRGGDMKTLSADLEKSYGITRRRAALIARDQNNKAKATIEAVRHQELGIRQAIWMHSKGAKEPRPTHVKANNKLYDLDRGMWDADENKFVHPGELVNCGCSMRPYIPGFETSAYPEWEITQT